MSTSLSKLVTRTSVVVGSIAVGGGLQGAAVTAAPAHDDGARELDDFTPLLATAGRAVAELTTSPPSRGGPTDDAPDDLKAGPGCSIQCITSGVAYAHGSDAELVVTTDTPARIWIMVWNDDEHYIVNSEVLVQSFSHLFDDLTPGTTYSAMATAVDAAGYVSDAVGSFTTLS
jgi:hypothetical protein